MAHDVDFERAEIDQVYARARCAAVAVHAARSDLRRHRALLARGAVLRAAERRVGRG